MYTLMIADDNAVERDYLQTFVEQHFRSDFQIIGKARDGKELLDLVHGTPPDIILLDIQMPKLNGLEAAEQLRKIHKDIVIIFITSYAEFSYAQQAVKLNVSDYLLKPYVDGELQETLETILRELRKKDTTNSLTEMQDSPNLLYLKTRYFLDRILLDEDTSQPIQEVLQHQIVQQDVYKTVVLFEITGEIQGLQLVTLLNGMFCKRNLHILTWIHGSETVLFLFGNKLRDFQELETSISRVRLFFHDETGQDIFCGVSSFYSDLTFLKKSYDEASSFITEFGPTEMKTKFLENAYRYRQEHQMEKRLLQTLTNKEENDTLSIIQQYCISSRSQYRAEYLAYLIISTVGSILAKDAEIPARISLAIQKIETAGVKEETIHAFLQTLVSESIEELGGISVYNNVALVKKATKFIMEHYQQKLTLQDVAESLHISYGHLSKCFKQITNLPFNQYLLEIRIREAMKLMDSTSLSFSEIGYQVGINDPNYFSKSFKKYAKMSPREYRIMNILGEIQS